MRNYASRTPARSLVAALATALAGAAPSNDAIKAVGTVVGRVIDLEGRPVAGASVWAGDRDQREVQARTDTHGRFRLESVSAERAGTIWAEDEAKGLAREHFDDVRVFAGRETNLGDIALAPGARLSGRVVDKQGRPVAGAETTIQSWHHELGHTITENGPKWTVRGDDQGRFHTPALPAGKADVAVRAPGKARRWQQQLVEPGQTAIALGDIRLDNEEPVTGIVVNQDGQPIVGASVVVDADYEHPATTDDKGRFVVRDAAIDAEWLRVEAPGYFDPALRPIHELKGARTDLRMTLQKAYTVEGSVIDAETGAPVALQQVQLCTVERDEDGQITLVG